MGNDFFRGLVFQVSSWAKRLHVWVVQLRPGRVLGDPIMEGMQTA